MTKRPPKPDFDEAAEEWPAEAQPEFKQPPQWFMLNITIRTPEEVAATQQDRVDVEYTSGASFLNAFRTENLTLCAQLERLVIDALDTGHEGRSLADHIGNAIRSVWNDGAIIGEQAELFLNGFSRQYIDAVYQNPDYLGHFRYLLDLPTSAEIAFSINDDGYVIALLEPKTLLDAIEDDHNGTARREFTFDGGLNDLPPPSGVRLH